jgi:3-oxoadipate enol-lactonase
MASSGSSGSLPFVRQFGGGEPLLLVHGLMLTGEMFDPVLDAFARRHRVIVPDLRGHGRSSDLPGPYTVEQMSEDLAEILDAHGVASTDVLGYSRGGSIAQRFTRDYPNRTRRLVLVCSYVSHSLSALERAENDLLLWAIRLLGTRGAARVLALMAWLPHPGGRSLSLQRARWLEGIWASGGKKAAIGAVRAVSNFDSRGWLGRISCPTLVLCGSKDMLASRAHCGMLARGIEGACLHVVEGAGHTLPWTHRERLVELTERWLSSSPEKRP